ncbi:MAG: hypothetical protein PWR01_72 [Clostridiales bacterium]|nr:hypothetical protein [Clostridiales bacterium]
MLPNKDFVRQSLDIHLFFARIMKEHSFFLQVGFTPRDTDFIHEADGFRRAFDKLLGETISLSNGVVNPEVLKSGEVITQYTLKAEMASSYLTGVRIPTELTEAEAGLSGGGFTGANPILEQRVFMLNQRAMNLVAALIQFKTAILSNVLSCKMFTVNYPLLIEHILREAKLYLRMIERIQNRESINIEREALEQEVFWNRIMAEHAKFIRGLLDPTEEELFKMANDFGNEFDQLTKEAKAAMEKTIPPAKVTEESLRATQAIRDFKAQGTRGLLECKIRSIIIPLLADHTLREANHYLRLLKTFQRQKYIKNE